MTNEEMLKACLEWAGYNEFVGLQKRGLWYRPNAAGYTSNVSEAGRYTREEAKKHEYPHDEPVRIVEFPLPPLTLDLCAELEAKLTGRQLDTYNEHLLNELTSGCRVCDFSAYPGDFIWHTKKEVRITALYKTIQKEVA